MHLSSYSTGLVKQTVLLTDMNSAANRYDNSAVLTGQLKVVQVENTCGVQATAVITIVNPGASGNIDFRRWTKRQC